MGEMTFFERIYLPIRWRIIKAWEWIRFPGLRQRFWGWLLDDVIKPEPGVMLPWPLQMIFAVLFPLKYIHYRMSEGHGYMPHDDTWIIYGKRYSGALFRHLSYGDDRYFKIIENKNQVITIQEYRHGQEI